MFLSVLPERLLPSRPPGVWRRSSNWIFIALLLITALAAALRLYRLDAKGLWVDEIFTAVFASADNDLAAVARGPLSSPVPTPPLWFLITHVFVKALGSSDAVVRLPSVIAGVLGIWAVYKVGEALFDRTIGLISAFLLAVSPAHLHFSQEARFYAGIVLFSLLTVYFLHRGVNSGEKKWWIGFTIATLANICTHLTAFLVLAVEILYACLLLVHHLVAAKETVGGRRLSETFALSLLISLVVITVCYAPMAPHIIRGIQGSRGLGNPDQIQGLDLSAGYFLSLLGSFGAGSGVALSLYVAAFLWGLINAIHKQRRQALLILLWTIVPFAVVLLLRPKHWFAAKYVIFILPLYLMTVSVGIARVARSIVLFLSQWNVLRPPRRLRTLSLVALVVIYGLVSVSGLDDAYAWQSDRWKSIGQLLTSNVQAQDAVVPLPLTLLTLPVEDIMAYYGPKLEEAHVIVVDNPSQMEDVLANHRRVWIVIDRRTDFSKSNEVLEWLELQPHVELSIGDGTKVLYIGKDQTQLTLWEEAKRFTNLGLEVRDWRLEIGRWRMEKLPLSIFQLPISKWEDVT
jgi:mannosyltransferase